MKRFFLIFLIGPVIFSQSTAQEVSVKALFDSSRIYLGDQIYYTVTIEKPVSYILSVPVFKDTLINKIEILNGPVYDTTLLKDGREKIVQKYLVTSFDSGFYQVPPVFAELRINNNIKRFYSDYSPLEVMRVKITPPDTATKFFDIIAPYREPVTLGEMAPWILILLVLSLAIWYGIRYFKKIRSRADSEEKVIPTDPAFIIAFRELEKLRAEKLWQKGELKRYYTRLTEIIRQYIELRFGILSLELTSGETLDLLWKSGFRDQETFGKLRSVLTGADLVKFAKYTPEASENETLFEYAWDFVSVTRQSEEEKQLSGEQLKEGGEL